MKKEKIEFISQLIDTLKESELKLEEFYEAKDVAKFNEMKKFILKIQKEIQENLK
ncbi:MAG: hypothetical protein OQK82_07455 [Candidatus Pacearchaeota archaeon]|nr:hypothetical protein [Candidatus Pacearchaeota archaeon]